MIFFERIRQDLAYAARGLARNPGFAATLLGTLALGVRASVAMFSMVKTVLLRPLPYADIESWRQSARSFSPIASYDGTSIIIEDRDRNARRVTAVHQSANLFEVLGVVPAVGRVFTAIALRAESPRKAMAAGGP